MTQKVRLTDQSRKLYEVKDWAGNKLRNEDDRQTRDALFAAMQAVGLAILKLEKVSYLTVDRFENYRRMDD